MKLIYLLLLFLSIAMVYVSAPYYKGRYARPAKWLIIVSGVITILGMLYLLVFC